MAYAIRCNFDRIQSHAQAVRVWRHKAVIFPRSPAGPRGLVDKRKRHLTIERTEAEDIILRLYGNPVVTWHKDNSLTVCAPHSTRSTALFGNHCTPAGMYVSRCSDGLTVTIDGRTYKVADQITFRERNNTWKADQITSPWLIPFVNRERARQAFDETGYKEFRVWFKVYVQMATRPYGQQKWIDNDGQQKWIDNKSVVIMLRDRKWRDLVTCRFPDAWNYPDQVLHKIRQAIYQEYDCIEHKSVPFLG